MSHCFEMKNLMSLRVAKGISIPASAPGPAPEGVATPKIKAPKKARRLPAAAAAVAPAAAATPVVLSVDQVFQEQSQWCWSACAVMVFGYYFPTIPARQCELAGWLSGNACCMNPGSSFCNIPCPASPSPTKPGDLACVEGVFKSHGVQCFAVGNAITQDALLVELQSGRPIGLGLRLGNSAKHMILVRGFYSDTGHHQCVM